MQILPYIELRQVQLRKLPQKNVRNPWKKDFSHAAVGKVIWLKTAEKPRATKCR